MSDEFKKMLFLLLQTLVDELDVEKVESIASEFYDKYVEPLDLPGPDDIIDPLLKTGFVWSIVSIVKVLREKAIGNEQN